MDATTEADVIHFDGASDARGSLFVAEHPGGLPFAPERLFIVTGVPAGDVRGNHAHRTCHQFLVCTSGVVQVVVTYPDGRPDEVHVLDAPDRGIHIRPLTWSTQQYVSHDAVLLVAASEPYDASEYITDFDEYGVLARAASETRER
jgi:UDP-2-acetamido-3-amino-2,3-dideoxy-glucuronate N-acetyltransferase